MSSSNGKLFLVVGPSGVGKGTLVNRLKELRPDWYFPPSVTTREPRAGESSGEQYQFVSSTEFDTLIAKNELLEWAVVHGAQRYGTLRTPILEAVAAGRIVIREVDIQGLISIRQMLDHNFFTSVFICPPSLTSLQERILRRQPDMSLDELEHRLASAKKELAQKNLADHELISIENGIAELASSFVRLVDSYRRT